MNTVLKLLVPQKTRDFSAPLSSQNGLSTCTCMWLVMSQNGGSYVLAVDAGRERILSVWQWQWGHLLGKVAVSLLPLTSG
jgi:hypothetical protein